MSPQNEIDRAAVIKEEKLIGNYRSVIGQLLYLRYTRPDIMYTLSQLCKFVANPGPLHFTALKRLLRYLASTRSLGMLYKRSNNVNIQLSSASDSDWAGDLDTRRSTAGTIHLINGNIVSFSSNLHQSAALSSCKAETVSETKAATSIVWLRGLLDELGFAQTEPTVLQQDHRGAIAFASSEINHSKMKHIALREHYLRELVRNGIVKPMFVPTSENIADIFTKSLGRQSFIAARDKLNLVNLESYNSMVEGVSRI